jgi:hypothetical protein
MTARAIAARTKRYTERNPKLGDYHLLGTPEEVVFSAEIDFDSLTEGDIQEVVGIETDEDHLQFELPEAFVATVGVNLSKYSTGADVASLMGLQDSTVDYILNYGVYNGLLDGYTLDSYAATRTKFRQDPERLLKCVKEIMDSGASKSMSGNERRLKSLEAIDIAIRGFNDSKSFAESIGINEDGERELYIPSMPDDLVLLCLHDYAKKGCVYMTEDGGKVYQLSASQREALE